MGYHFLLQGIFPTQWIEPGSPASEADALTSEPPGKHQITSLPYWKTSESFHSHGPTWSCPPLRLHCLPLCSRPEKAMAPHSSALTWKIPWTEEPGRLRSMGLLSRTRLSRFTLTFTHWRRKWQPTPVFLPGESQGQGSLVGCRLWVTQSRTRLKRLSSSSRSVY